MAVALLATWPGSPARAQQTAAPMGAVATRDARLSGGLEVDGPVARLLSNVSVIAFDHDAPIALHRGGHVLVCSTSEFHLLHAGHASALVFGLDRGAVEVFSDSESGDAFLTPDLKLVPITPGPLDLKLRVTREGDTCVDNSGPHAPVLSVTDPYSAANYRVLPGQHLLFVQGDLHRVVDHETSSCGCPPTSSQQLAGAGGRPLTAAQAAAAAAHPFPDAQSAGMAPGADAANVQPTGVAGSQITTNLSYAGGEAASSTSPAAPGAVAPVSAPASAVPEGNQIGFFHAIGRFFHKLFHGSAT